MEIYYLEIRTVHIWAAMTSFSLFLLRGLLFNAAGARWVMAWPLRYLSWTVDTVLLTAALMLMTIVEQYPVANGWLTVKVLLLIPYILLGHAALRAPTHGRRWAYLAGAAAAFLYVYSVARAHHPLGFLA